ncbi:MAG TPA: hypothetical protein VKX49_11960 [Bryobacteraceae bacterium]|nr:hypothetical protein [Bryobacteraceae bacterium]
MKSAAQQSVVPLFAIAVLCAAPASAAVVLDRIAVVVGKHVIKTSDIDRDLRVTAFLNGQRLQTTSEAKRQSAERLIDQEIIRQEIIRGSYRRPPESQAEALEQQLIRDRFNGSAASLRRALTQYSLTEDQLRSQLIWQMTVLQFIDERFRAGVYVSDQEVRDYYDQHLAELRKQYRGDSSFDALKEKVRELLQGERINANFSIWLQEARTRSHIEYKQEAFA